MPAFFTLQIMKQEQAYFLSLQRYRIVAERQRQLKKIVHEQVSIVDELKVYELMCKN
jgi:hypothetical protein